MQPSLTLYVGRRIIGSIPTLLIVALLLFGLLFIAPGDPAAVIAGDQATPEQVQDIRQSLGLDQPFVPRFFRWSGRVLHGDLGTSIFTQQPVSHMIVERLEPTLSLLALTVVLAVAIGVPLGVVAGWKKDSAADRAAMIVAVIGFTVPVFVIGYVLAFVFASRLRWLPVQGFVPAEEDWRQFLAHLILPALTLSIAYVGLIARMTRASMLDVLAQDHVRTAKAKGLPPSAILTKHVLLNAANPIVTVVGIGIAGLIGGTVVTETVFGIPGIGRLTVDAITHRDYPVIQGVGLFFSAALVGVNLLVDLVYRILDPRIRL